MICPRPACLVPRLRHNESRREAWNQRLAQAGLSFRDFTMKIPSRSVAITLSVSSILTLAGLASLSLSPGDENTEAEFAQRVPVGSIADQAFADASRARSDKRQAITSAAEYRDRAQADTRGRVQEIADRATAVHDTFAQEARGEADRFTKILGEALKQPGATRRRLLPPTSHRSAGRFASDCGTMWSNGATQPSPPICDGWPGPARAMHYTLPSPTDLELT